jgi:hypothetical protein
MSRMVGIPYRLTIAAFVAFVLAGCTSGLAGGLDAKPSAVEPDFSLDGLYTFVEDGTGTRNGAPATDLFKGETQWAFRTKCDEKGCVAAGGRVDPANPSAAPSQVFAADYADGKWTQVTLDVGGATCARQDTTFKSDQWSIWDITKADDKLSIKGTSVGTDDCNFVNESTSTLTRVGDLPAGMTLPDPADAPKRVQSYPANAFRGKYTADYKRADNGQPQNSEQMDVRTTCLRSDERCVTTTVNLAPRDPATPYALEVYQFANDKFTFKQTVGQTQCADGREGVGAKSVSLSLPPAPVPDPAPSVTGNVNVSVTGDCTGTNVYDANFTRTGD